MAYNPIVRQSPVPPPTSSSRRNDLVDRLYEVLDDLAFQVEAATEQHVSLRGVLNEAEIAVDELLETKRNLESILSEMESPTPTETVIWNRPTVVETPRSGYTPITGRI